MNVADHKQQTNPEQTHRSDDQKSSGTGRDAGQPNPSQSGSDKNNDRSERDGQSGSGSQGGKR
jgi:hypothetical protein